MKKQLLLFFASLLSLSGLLAQVIVPDLADSTLAPLPMNRFFLYTPADEFYENNYRWVCVKWDRDLDPLLELVSAFHQQEPVVATVPSRQVYTWKNAHLPVRFYMSPNIVMELIPRGAYSLLRFCYDWRSIKRSQWVDKALLNDYQMLASHLVFGAPLEAPFQYGQTREIYYLSVQERQQLGITDLYETDQYPEGETGGMDNNWSLEHTHFEHDLITRNWAPINRDTHYVFDFEEFTAAPEFLNGHSYELENGVLQAYGGSGYGAFDWHEIERWGDTVSIVKTTCVGHCGDAPPRYSYHRFDIRHRLTLSVHFPQFAEEVAPGNYYEMMTVLQKDEARADTLLHSYGPNGVWATSVRRADLHKKDTHLRYVFTRQRWSEAEASPAAAPSAFHQIYVGSQKMEAYFLEYLGYQPKIILMEIYRYGTFAYRLDSESGRYYSLDPVIMEN